MVREVVVSVHARRRKGLGPVVTAAVVVTVLAVLGTAVVLVAPWAHDDPAPAVPQWRRDTVYVTAVRTRIDYTAATDGELLDTARAVCDAAGQGQALEQLDEVAARRLRLDVTGAAFVVGVAVRAQCPEHSALTGAE